MQVLPTNLQPFYVFGSKKQGVCHTMALPFTLKKYLKEKEELWKLKYFTTQKYNLQNMLLKKKQPKSLNILELYN